MTLFSLCIKGPGHGGEVVITFDGLVVEVTCLVSVLSAPSVSSPVDCPGEALVFFRSLLDLHWISVSRPASSDEGITVCVKHLTALPSSAMPCTYECSFSFIMRPYQSCIKY